MGRRLRLRRKWLPATGVLRPTAASPEAASSVSIFPTPGPGSMTDRLLLLQRSSGNRYVQRVLLRASMAGGFKATAGIGDSIHRKDGGQPMRLWEIAGDTHVP